MSVNDLNIPAEMDPVALEDAERENARWKNALDAILASQPVPTANYVPQVAPIPQVALPVRPCSWCAMWPGVQCPTCRARHAMPCLHPPPYNSCLDCYLHRPVDQCSHLGINRCRECVVPHYRFDYLLRR